LEILNTLKKDDRWLGVVLGALGPVAAFLVFYPIRLMPAGSFLPGLLSGGDEPAAAGLMSLSLLANGIIFYLYTHYHKDETAHGILVATLIYAIIIIVAKLT
jgi:hypothetical protein